MDLSLTADNEQLGFSALNGSWNGKYGQMMTAFARDMRSLAMHCNVKFWNDDYYYYYDGIYVVVSYSIIAQAYNMFLEKFMITQMMGRRVIADDYFFSVIRTCNPLRPRHDVMCFSNGVLDLTQGKLPKFVPHNADYHCIYKHPYKYDKNAKCRKWQKFLHEVLPDKTSRTILQMFLGPGVIQKGEIRETHKAVELCLLLVGTGANGKSVVFDVSCALFGDRYISKMDYASLTADGDEGMRGRYPIQGCVFNWSSDTDYRKFGKKNTAMFKRLVSGEEVTYRKLGQNVMVNADIPYMIFNMNALPVPEDDSLGFLRRLQYVTFDVTIPENKRNPFLATDIIEDELPGVFNWVMRGAMELKRKRFRFPVSDGGKKAIIKSLLLTNPILSWLKAYDIRSTANARGELFAKIKSSDCYSSFVNFCHANYVDDDKIPSIQKFGRDMSSKALFTACSMPSGHGYKVYGCTLERMNTPIILDLVPDDVPDRMEELDDRRSYLSAED